MGAIFLPKFLKSLATSYFSCVKHLLWEWTCSQLKQRICLYTLIRLFHNLQGSIYIKLWGRRAARVIVVLNRLLNIWHTTNDFL